MTEMTEMADARGSGDHRDDAVDVIRDQWAALRPELDVSVIDIVGRVLRASALIVRGSDDALAAHALTRGEFDLLSALRRAGAPQSPGALRTISLATGPTTTKRLRALESKGLVNRAANPDDGRGALIALTPAGVQLIDEVMPHQLETERALLAAMSDGERASAVDGLRSVLASIEARRTGA